MTLKNPLNHKIAKHLAWIAGFVIVYYLLDLIPGSSPLKYCATLVSIVAITHTIRKDYMEAKSKGEHPSLALDKLLAIAALLIVFLASIIDDHSKYKSDRILQHKSETLAKTQIALNQTSIKLAEATNRNTKRAADDAAKTRTIADETKVDAKRIKQDEHVVILTQKVLTALAHQNNKIVQQNAIEQRHDALRQEDDARHLNLVTQEQAERTRDANKIVALHSDVLQASRSINSLRETLHGFDRTLNPLKDARLTYLEIMPLNNPDPKMQAYKALLMKAVQEYQTTLPIKDTPQITAVGSSIQTERGTTVYNNRLILARGSALFPTDTTSLPGSLFNVPVMIGVWHKSSWQKLPNGQTKLINLQPDMELDVSSQAVPELYYYPATKMLVLAYLNIPVAIDVSTGKIASLPDLEGSWFAIRENNYDQKTQAFTYATDNDVRRQCFMWRVSLIASNRFFLFDSNDLQHSLDGSGKPMCTFTFDSAHTSKTRAEIAPSFWGNIISK